MKVIILSTTWSMDSKTDANLGII